MIAVSGPMFEPAENGFYRSVHNKSGAHYNIYSVPDDHGMDALREMFPDGKCDPLNLVLFSTSGIHGSYSTIEEAEENLARGGRDDEGNERRAEVTFLILHPRIVCMRYGNCFPATPADIAFLKGLRSSVAEAVRKIGVRDAE